MFLCNVKGLTLYRTWAGVFGHNREAVHPYNCLLMSSLAVLATA